jgi:hypothetical protein
MNMEQLKLRTGQSTPLARAFIVFMLGNFLLAFLPKDSNAQFTPVTYNFQNQPAAVQIYDPAGNLPLEFPCLAANGYGQWMYGSDPDNSSTNAYLVGDSLSNISVSSLPRPNGIVDKAAFGVDDYHQYTVKVAANLLGSVRYVWPNETKTGFIVRGLNDSRGTQGTQINIAIDGNLNPFASRKIIIGGAYHVTDVSNDVNNQHYYMGGWVPAVENEDLGTSYEANWMDQWDVAIDAKYLYIVWGHYDGNYGGYEVFLNAIQLSDGSVATGFPIPLHNRVLSLSTAGRGRRPTVSCDVRNNPASPTCDIAYIMETSHAGSFPDPSTPYAASVRYCAVRTGAIAFDHILPTSLPVPPSSVTQIYSNPLHARIITSSTSQGMAYPVKDVYVIANSLYSALSGVTTNSPFLLVHRIESDIDPPPANTTVHYVDGALLTTHGQPLLSGAFPVVDDPLRAFVNPYDGENALSFDEFHALYRMQRPLSSTPLLIVHGFNNGFVGTTDTRTVVNRTRIDNTQPYTWMIDPGDQFLGAANQAGIHVHWGTQSGVHCYSRDIRSFDEPIEENTLLSYEGRVADGTSHGGTVGAALSPARQFTMWTDPLFNNGALFVAPHTITPNWSNARLKFTSNNSILQIGSGITTDPGSVLTVLPNYECWFGGIGQEISIKPNSTLNYYGIPEGQLQQNIVGPGILRLTGTGITTTATLPGHSFPATIANAGNLYIRGGATLRIPDEAQMLTDKAFIELKYEPNLLPLSDPSPTANPPVSGKTNQSGHVSIANSIVASHLPTTENDFKTSLCTGAGCSSMSYQFEASESLFQNSDPAGALNIFFDATSSPVRIVGGKLRGVSISGIWATGTFTPVYDIKPFEVGFATFDQIHAFGVDLELNTASKASLQYHGIYLHNNDFKAYATANADGILIQGFITTDLSVASQEDQVEVSNNTFTTAVGFSDTNHVRSAVRFQLTSGGILSNQITGAGYANGVILEDNGFQDATSTLICNNAITGCSYNNFTGSGISGDYWGGYSKMNKISGCNRGMILGDYGEPYILFSKVSGSKGGGLVLNKATTYPDLRGVHHYLAPSTDYSSYDTIISNNQSGLDPAELTLIPGSHLYVGGPSTDLYIGKNNFVDNGLGEYLISSSTSATIFGPIDNNYWQHLSAAYFPALSGDAQLHNISYSRSASDPNRTSYFACPFASSVSCSGGFISPIANGKGANPTTLSIDTDECTRLREKTGGLLTDNYFQTAYDTGRSYMQHCALLNGTWGEFGKLNWANQSRGGDMSRYLDYREWLKAVLYLNTIDSDWYCADAFAITGTFKYFPNTGWDMNGELAVMQYILKSAKCPHFISDFSELYTKVRLLQHQQWLDSSKGDTNLNKLDTTLPSLHSIGLDILLGRPEHSAAESATFDIAGLHATVNPFTKETEIAFELGDRELMQLRVYDALGRVVFDNGIGNVLEAGARSFKIDGKNWANGVYYARLSTNRGLVRTLKLQHLQ